MIPAAEKIARHLAVANGLTDTGRNGHRTELSNATGSLLSFLIAALRKEHTHILFLSPDPEKAASMASDLQQLTPDADTLLFPSTHRKPYDDQMVVDSSLLLQRSDVLERLERPESLALFASAEAISDKLLPAREFHGRSILIRRSDDHDPEELRGELTDQGYRSVRFVNEPGEFAVRGGIFDVFPYSGEYPVRLEFFGNEVDSIRQFDPDSQRSVAFLDETRIVPDATSEQNGERDSLLDYLPDNTLLILEDPDLTLKTLQERFVNAEEAWNKLEREAPAPGDLLLSEKEFMASLESRELFFLGSFTESFSPADSVADLKGSRPPACNGSFKLLRQVIERHTADGIRTWILCNNDKQKERFRELLGEPDETLDYLLKTGSVHGGFVQRESSFALMTDHEIFNRYHRPSVRRKGSVKGGISFKELRDLNIGDYVVHVDYGIGKFAGFRQIEVKKSLQEVAVLTYKENSTLYVNVSSLHKLQKYSGKEGTAPRVTRLGSGEWAKKKSRTRKKVKDIARDLIKLYAKRKTQKAHPYPPDMGWQKEMEARFEFEETPDQMKAIEEVKADMESEQPMDRLICGDVGFGKTEVAIRAAFKAVMDQKQVAILVPTTILADQHYQTFRERMESFPVEIEMLSRFRSPAEQKEVLERVKAGKVDILIGTHRIVSKDVVFRDLGLMIVDEEQRFGVGVKEKLKEYRASMDVLTMTATPIPRTLQFSLMGARDLSIIHTPPPNRQPVYTEIHSFNHERIRDAILQERSRGGQIFFIHNRVQNIEEVADMIRQLVPGLKVRLAHGQMKSKTLEKIIHDFYQHKFDCLVSTNIVENGIDISNANTIMINNAHHFGLSELHQLRGRVGRSNRKAFCYLLTPPVRTLSAEARKRLTALEEFSDLGSGFNIAMRDLDIRGAGDVLGAEQSGFINEIGFEMYSKILDDAVREIKHEEFGDLFEETAPPEQLPDTQIEFDHPALLEESYVTDHVERLNLYRKLSRADKSDDLDEWEEEIRDRFGPLPEAAENLLMATRIRLAASRLFYRKVTIRAGKVWLLCPRSGTDSGRAYYDSGRFQRQLGAIESITGGAYRLVQKKESVRIILEEVGGIAEALRLLETIRESVTEDEEVTA